MQWYHKFQREAAADSFELQLAILNAYGEVGDLDKCHAVLTEMLTQNPQHPHAGHLGLQCPPQGLQVHPSSALL